MNRLNHFWLALLAVVLVAAGRPAEARAQAAAADTAVLSDQVIDAGRAIFHGPGTCHACHGDDLQGGPMAPSLRGPKWRHIDGSFGQILHRIREGRDGTLMVALPGDINGPQALQVATYVWAVSQGKAKP
jgi:mono/diheme cytochrome c family protein